MYTHSNTSVFYVLRTAIKLPHLQPFSVTVTIKLFIFLFLCIVFLFQVAFRKDRTKSSYIPEKHPYPVLLFNLFSDTKTALYNSGQEQIPTLAGTGTYMKQPRYISVN